ncbi:hypothetical protein [Nocardia vaccinii]|uniref:hypothetical protein n=1 Tax=Nocardia vaccinii TaxID=1822 RepID=UPI0008296C6C|nr:hypothetical protein [Nocardia vaccinii]
MNEFRTETGETVRVGDHFRDSRKSNIRTLRVDSIETRHAGEHAYVVAHCVVVRQEYDGEVTTPMRSTSMDADRLLSRAFVRAGLD